MPKPTPKTIEVIYEDGVLKPLEPLNLPEHQPVEITISPKAPRPIPREVQRMIDLLQGPLPIRSAEEMAQASEIDVD